MWNGVEKKDTDLGIGLDLAWDFSEWCSFGIMDSQNGITKLTVL